MWHLKLVTFNFDRDPICRDYEFYLCKVSS
jgi:hypothetical protein